MFRRAAGDKLLVGRIGNPSYLVSNRDVYICRSSQAFSPRHLRYLRNMEGLTTVATEVQRFA
jgi:hypothetical protein